jgi:hypothetical protein
VNNLSTLTAQYESRSFIGHDNIHIPNSEYAHRMHHVVTSLGQDRDAWKELAEQMYYLVKSEQEVKALELFVDAVLSRKRLEVEAGL